MPAKFPEVQGGGSLILAWQIRNKNVLVIGGGEASLSTISSRTPLDSDLRLLLAVF
jgi:precorrin-2 dehydrogenase/sirohydrochlorin ferrochelatase